ncbi:MAG: putative toxin-antitoxin system toxin component, PIN family [Phycisphaerae bacterium]
MKVVPDTNALLAAFGTRGLCEAVFEICLTDHQIVLCEHILRQLNRHLRGKFHLPAAAARETVDFLRTNAALVEPAAVPPSACRDESDLPVLGTADAAGADCLISGDTDLLSLGRFGRTLILSPRQFHDHLT